MAPLPAYLRSRTNPFCDERIYTENYTFECSYLEKLNPEPAQLRFNRVLAFFRTAVQGRCVVRWPCIIIFSTSIKIHLKINAHVEDECFSQVRSVSLYTRSSLARFSPVCMWQSAFSDSNVLLAAAQNRHDSHQIFWCAHWVLNNHHADCVYFYKTYTRAAHYCMQEVYYVREQVISSYG